jgi:hypothetical protein
MKNTRLEILIESEPERSVSVKTEVIEILMPEYNTMLDGSEICKTIKKYLKNKVKMVTISVIVYEQGNYTWNNSNIKDSIRFIKKDYDGIEFEKRPIFNGSYPDSFAFSYATKDILESIKDLANTANNCQLNNIRDINK